MADAPKKLEFYLLESLWIKKALENQRQALIRSRTKEVAGSEVYTLRGKEIESLTQLIQKFT